MIIILIYMMYYVELLNTHPCDLCYDLTKGVYQPRLDNLSIFTNV